MPYIKKDAREKWQAVIKNVAEKLKELPVDKLDGELNYLITSILTRAYSPGYFNYNRAIGLLECIKQEFYRRFVAPYEDEKKEENGDVI